MAKKKPRGHVVVKHAVKRRSGCFYFVDKAGNLRETEMRKRGRGARNDLCKPTAKKKRRKKR